MAFQSSAARTQQAPASTDNWKAQGFLNLYLPSKEVGKRRKLGAVPLRADKPAEKALLDFLNEDPSRVGALMAKLVMEYQSAEASESNGFDLG